MFLFPPIMIKRLNQIVKRSVKEIVTLGVLVLVAGYFVLPTAARATANAFAVDRATALEVAAMENATRPFGSLPQSDLRNPSYVMRVTATAYNSLPEQTDDTPFITASGSHVRPGVIAANFLPMGTMVKIPDYFGDQIFVVEDRMNPRYDRRIDIWMEHQHDARQFGVRTVAIEVYRGN